MAHPDSTNSSSTKESCADENTEALGNEPNDKSPKCVSNDRSSPDICLRDRVLKEVGLTSSAFIGPAFPPESSTTKSDIEESLSDFYKELENIDTPDGPNEDVLDSPTSKNTQGEPEGKTTTTWTSVETNSFQNKSGKAKPSWPHWYQDAPYHLKSPMSNPDSNHWPHRPPPNRPAFLRFHRPPFPYQPPQPAYQNPQNYPPHISVASSSLRTTHQYSDEFFLPAFPPSDLCNHGNSPHPSRRNDLGHYNMDSDYAEWSQDRREEWSQCGENYNQPQRFISEQRAPQHPFQPYDNTHNHHSASVLILMRGLPGSGKTTRARELLPIGPCGVILSTDDYFAQKYGYQYDPGLLGVAHEWNQSRANNALNDGRSPVIIDNTNLQAWEMKPYVKMALERGYKVDFCEPETSWKFDPLELEKRNKHGVPQEKIKQMMDRFSSPVSIDIIMSSEEPAHVNQRRWSEQQQNRKKPRFY
uniref:NEDD4 binding protein 2-like 2 n=1 Tax=Nothobranchius kadleci TaxID=1051664 RepID=A0A1A8CBZ1_NOTKA